MNPQLALEKQHALHLSSTLDLPSFKYGQGMTLHLPELDFERAFVELSRAPAEPLQITADSRVKIRTSAELDHAFLNLYFQTLVPLTEHKIIAQHYASLGEIHALTIPKNQIIDTPIIIHSRQPSFAAAYHLMVVAEEGSQATIIETVESSPSAHYQSRVVQAYVHAGAQLTYGTVHNRHPSTFCFSTQRGAVQQDARLTWLDIALGGNFTQLNQRTMLQASGARVQKFAAFLGTGNQLLDINAESIHQASHTFSLMKAKGVLAEQSKAVYRGTIKVEKAAVSCVGQQRSEALLVGEKARCDAIPVLEVDNDDVTCSHGSSIGQLDEEQLYYLCSRGLDLPAAKKIILTGFLQSIFQQLPEKNQEHVLEIISQKLSLATEIGTCLAP